MKAIILAAGRGSRMKSLTEQNPKCLVQLHGKALLDWQLDSLRKSGITQIAIVTGYKRELLINRGLVEFYNSQWSKTNMVSSLACAEEWLKTETCIVSYSDIFYSSAVVELLIESKASLALTYDQNWLELWTQRFGDPLLDAETFLLDNDKTILEIGKKPKSLDQIQGQYIGLLKFTPSGWAEIERIRSRLPLEIKACIHMTDILQKVIEAGRVKIQGIPFSDGWGEVDSEDDLKFYSSQKNNYKNILDLW
jgi:choline kinase